MLSFYAFTMPEINLLRHSVFSYTSDRYLLKMDKFSNVKPFDLNCEVCFVTFIVLP